MTTPATSESEALAIAARYNLPFMSSIVDRINEKLLRSLPPSCFTNGTCFPILGSDTSSDTIIDLALADPTDFNTILDIQAATGMVAQITVTTTDELERCRQRFFGAGHSGNTHSLSNEYEKQKPDDEDALSLDEIKRRTESEPIVKMVSLLFSEAIAARASDIHIEPAEFNAVVRFRVDGMLKKHTELARAAFLPLTSRIKILADLDIAEKRVPQDGRLRYEQGGEQYDFRISTLPTHYGEKTVLRILKHDKGLLDVTLLGIPKPELAVLLDHIEKPQGILFVTGPTGSGKSSTLFACLNRIRRKAINITTIENPIEYKLDGINQVQVNEKAGVTFSSVLRSILRQDPDVILVGEIRDRETAEIAIQASQTGHLVFATLHTNDAISAVTRLKDLGVPSFLVASSLLSVLAQRLVRVLCPHCRTRAPLSADLRSRWKTLFGNLEFETSFTPKGCEKCSNSGYKGRTGVFELVPVTEKIREIIAANAPEAELRAEVRRNGFNPLMQNGIELVRSGVTSVEELLRVVLIDDTVK